MSDPLFTGDSPVMRLLWPFLASMAGAITALSFQPWQGMSWKQISLAVFVGFSFSYFVSPWVAYVIFKDGPVSIRVLGMIFYMMATGSNILIPLAIRRFGRAIGADETGGKP